MSHIDDLFRDGLGKREAPPSDTDKLWSRIQAARTEGASAHVALDEAFRKGLRDRTASVPPDMWRRIVRARTLRPVFRWVSAAAVLLLLLAAGIGFQQMTKDSATVAGNMAVATAAPLQPSLVASDHQEREGRPSPAAVAAAPSAPGAQQTSGRSVPPAAEASDSGPAAGSGLPATAAVAPAAQRKASMAVLALPSRPAAPLATERELPATAPLGSTAFHPRPRGIQTELLFGISYARQEFHLQSPEAADLRTLREFSEFPEFGYQITLRGTRNLSQRLRLAAGLTFAEIRNELEYELLSNTGTTLVRTNNSLRMLEAPVLLGYSVPGRRLNVTINAGPVVNLLVAPRGSFLHPDFSQPLDLATDGNYRANVGIGFMTSLSTAYQVGRKNPFTLLVEPFFKAYPSAFTEGAAALQERYWVAGIQLGVRKTLR